MATAEPTWMDKIASSNSAAGEARPNNASAAFKPQLP
jgi:hypothetical protein